MKNGKIHSKKLRALCLFVLITLSTKQLFCQSHSKADHNASRISSTKSVARRWNEALLQAIRLDPARPTINARTLFHLSVALYDAWAVYDVPKDGLVSTPFFLGKKNGNYNCPFDGVSNPENIEEARTKAMSYAAYRLLYSRFKDVVASNGYIDKSKQRIIFDTLLANLKYNPAITTSNYASGDPAELGNYLGYRLIDFGFQDGSNENQNYSNQFYKPVNPPLQVFNSGDNTIVDPNRWQPLSLQNCLDQGNGAPCPPTQTFLSAEWGNVVPFALNENSLIKKTNGTNTFKIYHDPGPFPKIEELNSTGQLNDYMWSFLVALVWSSHLDIADNRMIDISPARQGNISVDAYPTNFSDLRTFYNLIDGGDIGKGYPLNPKTNLPYSPQVVLRGDYTRVLSEFWADGPNSETPPGHWFTILNKVSDNLPIKKWKGNGSLVDDLEWDVKSYLALGGAMHDAAITAWGIKGYYDGVRPVSAIRYMAELGQSSDITLPNYNVKGLPIIPGLIELIQADDSLAKVNKGNINQLKVFAWRGPQYVTYTQSREPINAAGVGWILAKDWYPYQRSSFVTPPFAGYISGHSTYSSAGAEVLSEITGDEFFPGGLGEFAAPKLVFEKGPRTPFTLQWARYKDAADQSALSRIWGGIHPPMDDITGRRIGKVIATAAVKKTDSLLYNVISQIKPENSLVKIYPNPVHRGNSIKIAELENNKIDIEIISFFGRKELVLNTFPNQNSIEINTDSFNTGVYLLVIKSDKCLLQFKVIIL